MNNFLDSNMRALYLSYFTHCFSFYFGGMEVKLEQEKLSQVIIISVLKAFLKTVQYFLK